MRNLLYLIARGTRTEKPGYGNE